MNTDSLKITRFDHKKQRFVLNDTAPRAVNAFDWRRFTDEERAARGETKNLNDVSHKRSKASTAAVNRKDIPQLADFVQRI
jgi:hypothetical protein